MIEILQLEAETYVSMFLADMIALYLLLQLITHCSISETNLDAHHVKHVIIMIKKLQN